MVVGWGVSIEVRMAQATDVTGRLKSIEEALYPILVDYKVNQIIGDARYYGGGHEPGRLEPPAPNPDPPIPYPDPLPPPPPPVVSVDDPPPGPDVVADIVDEVPDEVPDRVPAIVGPFEPLRSRHLSDIHIEAEDWAKQQLPFKR